MLQKEIWMNLIYMIKILRKILTVDQENLLYKDKIQFINQAIKILDHLTRLKTLSVLKIYLVNKKKNSLIKKSYFPNIYF